MSAKGMNKQKNTQKFSISLVFKEMQIKTDTIFKQIL